MFGAALWVGTLAVGCGPSAGSSLGVDVGVSTAVAIVDRGRALLNSDDRQRVDSVIEYGEGRKIDEIVVKPSTPRAGGPLTIEFVAHGLVGQAARVGFLPARAASRQEVRYDDVGSSKDMRSLWHDFVMKEGVQSVEFQVPTGWQSRSAVVVLELADGTGGVGRAPIVAGPSSGPARSGVDSGLRGLLAMVDVQTLPVKIKAARVPGGAMKIDGLLDESSWNRPGHALTMAADGEPQQGMGTQGLTRVLFAYDDDVLYMAAEIPDIDIYSRFSDHDDPLWTEEALELFIHGVANKRDYIEYQVSARNVTFDAQFEHYRKGDESFDSRWKTAVHVRGSINKKHDRDRGWSVEAAIPWSEICEFSDAPCGENGRMRSGSRLRLNVVRVERVRRKEVVALTLSPLRSLDFHASGNAAILEIE